MLADILGLVLTTVALLSLALQRFYSCVPAKELKRLAARGERMAVTLYRPVAYGVSLRVLLWLVAVICLPLSFLLLVQQLPAAGALLIMMVAVGVGVVWLPSRRLTAHSAKLAAWSAPTVEWVLHYVHGPLGRLADVVSHHRALAPHSGLYEKDDMHDLLAQQQTQQDSRIDPNEIELMQRALHFNDTKAVDVAVPRKDVPMLSTSDTLGPILFDELHKSGQQSFVVYRGKHDNVVGVVSLGDTKHAKQGGTVADIMKTDLCFVGEDFSLAQLSQAFALTGQQIAVVINKFEEFVGIVSFGNLMDFLFAAQISKQSDIQYEDRVAVANYEAPNPEKETPDPVVEEVATSPEPSEVVE